MAKPRRTGKKKEKKSIPVGLAHVHASFNNTIISFTDLKGNVVSWASAGASFKGSRKSTPFAAQIAAETAARKAQEQGVAVGGGGGQAPVVRPPCAPLITWVSRSASSAT